MAELHEEVNPSKTTHLRRLCAVDIGNVRDAVLALPADAWDRPETFGVNYNKRGALRQTAHVIFRFSDRRTAPIRYLVLPIWHEWRARLLPLLRAAVLPLGYRTGVFPRVMLAKLPSGAFIPPHTDGDARGSVPHKIHIPIVTNPRAYFFEDVERMHLDTGVAYEVNNGIRHSAVNGGSTDRIHLVFEYLDGDRQTFIPSHPMPADADLLVPGSACRP